jgi:hypothetical protein
MTADFGVFVLMLINVAFNEGVPVVWRIPSLN